MSRPRRSFSPEFKLRVLQEVESGQSQASVARKYELSPHLILEWKKAFQSGRLGGGATGDLSVEELRQDQQIKAEIIQEQAQEIHLLKKALALRNSTSQTASGSSAKSGKPSRSRKPAP